MNRLYTKENRNATTPSGVVSLAFTPPPPLQIVVNQQVKTHPALHWFPMRVTYHREMKIKALLDDLGIDNFLPMRWEIVETKGGGRKRILLPAIHNLIFVRSTQEYLTNLKTTREEFSPLRYMMRRPLSSGQGNGEIIRVPDRQMENFMRVASVKDDRVMFLENSDYINKVGQHVKVIDGYFAGVEGIIKRINKNKRVVVQLEGLAAVAIAFVPANQLSII